MRRVDLSISTAICLLPRTLDRTKTDWSSLEKRRVVLSCLLAALSREFDYFLRRFVHRIGGREVHAALVQQALALFDVGAFHADDDRHRDAELLHRGDHPLREHVAAEDAAE